MSDQINDMVRELTSPRGITCDRRVECHVCTLDDCPRDDPDHVHLCYYDDFDFTEGDYQRLRRGEMSMGEFLMIGERRSRDRRLQRHQRIQRIQRRAPST